jgi:superfamily I DNA/RNA helicase/CRISPR/Cas system-associated exonuclease Cas4 (RecB family)
MEFLPDERQAEVLEHSRGALLVAGGPGTGKTAVLRERLARLIEGGADPERVALVVRTKGARAAARAALLERLRSSLPSLRVLTVHGLAHRVMADRFAVLGYDAPPRLLTAADQFSRVRELLGAEPLDAWPAYGAMLGLRGFADEVRQFLFRAQEALLGPEEVAGRAEEVGLTGWRELASFYRRYVEILDSEGAVDFAGLVVQAAAAAAKGDSLFDHLLVDDYQEGTFAMERLVADLKVNSLVAAGDLGSHVFSFQGTTDQPLRRFAERLPGTRRVTLSTCHRSPQPVLQAWFTRHASEEHGFVARELRRIHAVDEVPWSELAVVVRRQGSELSGLLRALDDAGVPRTIPEAGVALLAEPAAHPYVLALRWLARPGKRDGLVESLLTSDLARLSPAAARGLVRSARAVGQSPAQAIEHQEGLSAEEAGALGELRSVLAVAEGLAARSVLEAFRALWTGLACSRRLVEDAERSPEGRRRLEPVLALADAVERASERAALPVAAFLESLEAGEEGPGQSWDAGLGRTEAVRVLTAHGSVGQEFDSVFVAGAVEGNFPSLARPEPMFDLAVLERRGTQSERNRLRLEDERRLFRVVTGRARRRVIYTASDPRGIDAELAAHSRFVSEAGVTWVEAPLAVETEPLTVAEAGAAWRRRLADPGARPEDRLAALEGLLALQDDPARWWFQRDWTRTDRPLHETIRTSYSKLDKLDNCALQYVLAEELGLDDRAGYQAWVGHLVHRIIEDCENGVIERDLGALIRVAEGRWRRQEFPSFAISEAFRRVVVDRILPNWFNHYGESRTLAQELQFDFELDGAQVVGYIDRIGGVERGGSVITDYKTGKAKDVVNPQDNLQLGMYYLAVERAEELARFRPVRAVELAYLKEEPKRDQAIAAPMAIAQLAITPKIRDDYEAQVTERVTGLIGRVRDLIQTETYRPNPKADCFFCRFKPICPLFPEGAELFPADERSGRAEGVGAAEEASR